MESIAIAGEDVGVILLAAASRTAGDALEVGAGRSDQAREHRVIIGLGEAEPRLHVGELREFHRAFYERR
jgi:hypothetical protein